MKKNDMIIIAVGLILAVAVYVGIEINKQIGTSDSMVVEVHYDGKVLDTYALDEEGVYMYEHDHGFNEIEIKDGQVNMLHADCPDLSCTKQYPISHTNENIVCLPYKFHLVIVGEEEVLIDAISK